MLPDEDAAIIGSSSRLFRVNIVATVLFLIEEAWQSVRKRKDVVKTSEEKVIAGALYRELWNAKKRLGLEGGPPKIDDEGTARRNEKSIKPDGFIDFKFGYAFEEQGFFGLECKRVNSTDPSLAKEYVEEGVMRFVTGKYCPGHDIAAMLGFVVDSNLMGSVALVRDTLLDRQVAANMKGQWIVSTMTGIQSSLYQTLHRQHGQLFDMTILHLFQEL